MRFPSTSALLKPFSAPRVLGGYSSLSDSSPSWAFLYLAPPPSLPRPLPLPLPLPSAPVLRVLRRSFAGPSPSVRPFVRPSLPPFAPCPPHRPSVVRGRGSVAANQEINSPPGWAVLLAISYRARAIDVIRRLATPFTSAIPVDVISSEDIDRRKQTGRQTDCRREACEALRQPPPPATQLPPGHRGRRTKTQ